jgi:hypothetical protein
VVGWIGFEIGQGNLDGIDRNRFIGACTPPAHPRLRNAALNKAQHTV